MALLYQISRQLVPRYSYSGFMDLTRHFLMGNKPPNIIVHSGKNEKVFAQCRDVLQSVLEPDCYTIYDLDAFRNSQAWIPNTKLLVLANNADPETQKSFEAYFSSGGPVLSFSGCCSGKVDGYSGISLEHPLEFYRNEENRKNLSKILASKFQLKCRSSRSDFDHKPSKGYLLSETKVLDESLRARLQSVVGIPITVNNTTTEFQTSEYFKYLKTEKLGRAFFYADVVTSTHTVLEQIGEVSDGFAVISRYQSNGKGRSGNVWLSPKGCAMFSIQLHMKLHSELGQQLCLLQHLAALAIVRAVKKHSSHLKSDIGVKWPNDIYYQKFIKIGGVLTTSSIFGREVICNIGCGVNLDNDNPTTSVNRILEKYSTPHLSYEKYFAEVFNEMEDLLELLENNQISRFLEFYYEDWIHNNSRVTVYDNGVPAECEIVGVDESGYLKVCKPDGRFATVHPDGNSFDLLNGLIIPK